jgi:AraC-like DNA-binding protein
VVESTLGPLDLTLPRGELGGRDRLRVGDLGAVRVVELATGEASQATRRRRHITSSDPPLLKVDVQTRGRGVIDQSGRNGRYQPGDLTLVDLSRPCTWANDPAAGLVAISFPRELLPVPDDDVRRLAGVRLPGDHGSGALVSALARRLPHHLDELDAAEGARLGTTMLDLLSVALLSRLGRGREAPPRARRRTLLARIHAHIERHLDDPDLSPGRIAAAHFISVRYLHLLFEGERTTVAERIRQRRLDRCRRDLLDPAQLDVPVSAIGARWGLGSAAHFSRLFRAAYGVPPARYRESARDVWTARSAR